MRDNQKPFWYLLAKTSYSWCPWLLAQGNRNINTDNQIISHPLEENLVVFRNGGDRLHILDPLACWIWESCTAGVDLDEIAHDLAQQYQIPVQQAIRDVRNLAERFRLNALLPGSTPLQHATPKEPPGTSHVGTLPNSPPLFSSRYRLAGCRLQVDLYDESLEQLITPLFQHLQDHDAVSEPHHHIAVYRSDNGYELIIDRTTKVERANGESIAVALYWQFGEVACNHADWLLAIHGGAVEKHGVSIILSGASGSGKSTLIAALAASGFRGLGDEVIQIPRGTQQAIAIPLPLCIKEGSWQALKAYYPTLEDNRVFPRHDKRVKFLPADKNGFMNDAVHSPALLLFLKYKHGADRTLSKLSATEALQGLIEADSLFGNPLDSARVAEQLEWIGRMKAYRLIYGGLEEAIHAVDELVDLQDTIVPA